jgi:hypothetical protein
MVVAGTHSTAARSATLQAILTQFPQIHSLDIVGACIVPSLDLGLLQIHRDSRGGYAHLLRDATDNQGDDHPISLVNPKAEFGLHGLLEPWRVYFDGTAVADWHRLKFVGPGRVGLHLTSRTSQV